MVEYLQVTNPFQSRDLRSSLLLALPCWQQEEEQIHFPIRKYHPLPCKVLDSNKQNKTDAYSKPLGPSRCRSKTKQPNRSKLNRRSELSDWDRRNMATHPKPNTKNPPNRNPLPQKRAQDSTINPNSNAILSIRE
jgi:hypothetical protein